MLEKIALIPIIVSSIATQDVEANSFATRTETQIQIVAPYFHQINDISDKNKVKTGNTACGPTALTIVFNYLGLNINIENVIARLPASVYILGDQFYNLMLGAEIFGFKYVVIENSPTAIFNALNKGHLVMLNIQNYDGILGHAVVVTGITGYDGKNANSLIVHDPFRGPYREFIYVDNQTLMQPEGYINPIGTLQPFYIK